MKKNKTVLILLAAFFLFAEGLQAEQGKNSRVIYEENTSFKDATHRAEIISEIDNKDSARVENAQQKQLPADSLMEKILPVIEKFLGQDAAAILNAYKKASAPQPDAAEDASQQEKGDFKEFSDEHQWKGLRQTN